MLRKLYDWTLRQAAHPHATIVMGVISFAESVFFPIPIDILLIPMVIAKRTKAFLYAFVATITSTLGAGFGYLIGAFLFVEIAQPILEIYGYMDKFEIFKSMYNENGIWAVMIGALSPIPFKVVTITSGATGMAIIPFLITSFLARGLRYFLICAILYFFGEKLRYFVEKYMGLIFTLFVILLIGGFVVIKFLV